MPSRIEPVHSPQMFVFGIPRLAETFESKPSAPLTPVLKMPISTRVAPKRASLMTLGENVCVSPRVIPFELPNSSPAEGPAGKSLLFGEVPSGKKLSRPRNVLDLLYRPKIEFFSVIR